MSASEFDSGLSWCQWCGRLFEEDGGSYCSEECEASANASDTSVEIYDFDPDEV